MENRIFSYVDAGVSTLDGIFEKEDNPQLEDEIYSVVNKMTEQGYFIRYTVSDIGEFYTINNFSDNDVDRTYRLIRAGIDNREAIKEFTGDSDSQVRWRIQSFLNSGKIIRKPGTVKAEYIPNPADKTQDFERSRIDIYAYLIKPKAAPEICKQFNKNEGFVRNHLSYLMARGFLKRNPKGRGFIYSRIKQEKEIVYTSVKAPAVTFESVMFPYIRSLRSAS